MLPRSLPFAACALALALVPDARASAVLDRPIEEMTARSALVVRGKVVKTEARWDASHRRIQTYTQVRVSESLKGQAPATVLVRQPGGHVGELEQLVAGAAEFAPGEDVVLFLERAPDEAGAHLVAGMSAGAVRLERANTGELRAVRRLSGLELVKMRDRGPAEVRVVDRDDLGEADAFLRRVRAAAPKKPEGAP